MTIVKSWGMRVLAALLLALGVITLVPALQFQGWSNIAALLAIAAGALILLEK